MFVDLADLTADRVGRVLVEAGAATGTLRDCAVERIGGTGFLGTLARVRLRWDGDGPASLVAKLPTTIAANQQIVDHFRYDEREAGVYRDLSPWEVAPAPRALAQSWDPERRRGWLLLEDLHTHAGGDGVDGAADAQARAATVALAEWHAAFWNDERLPRLPWLPSTLDPVVAGYGQIFDHTWELCVANLGGVDAATTDASHEARRWFDTAVEEFATGSRTLVHGDARVDNVRFGSDGAVLLDFQLATFGRGIYDLAFFCAGSLRTEDRRRLEPDLVALYRTTLAARGVTIDPETLWRDYRLGHMMNLPNPVSALAVVTPADERGAEFLRRNARRGLAAVADHVALLG